MPIPPFVAEDSARFDETELDFERGVEVYEIEFSVGRTEYSYEINAKTGEIVKAERDTERTVASPDRAGLFLEITKFFLIYDTRYAIIEIVQCDII